MIELNRCSTKEALKDVLNSAISSAEEFRLAFINDAFVRSALLAFPEPYAFKTFTR